MIDEDGVVGLTSNPTIFDKAISSGASYDAALSRLARAGKSSVDIYEARWRSKTSGPPLIFFDRSMSGPTGWTALVSLEVSPHLAYDTQENAQRGPPALGGCRPTKSDGKGARDSTGHSGG